MLGRKWQFCYDLLPHRTQLPSLNQNSYLPVDGIKQSEPIRMAACLRILQLKIIQTWPKMIYLYKVSSIALGGHLNFEGSHRRQALKTN
jgi:hypothetical protein